MLRITLLRRPFHTNAIIREEWTKASLRRMKKVELTRLAKDNHLNFSGTKNDIIIQLLTHQTAKIVGTNTPSLQTIQKVVQEPIEAIEASKSIQPTEESKPTQPIEESKPAETSEHIETSEAIEANDAWMNAFEMKVAQRGSRKPLDIDPITTTTTTSKPHRYNDEIKPAKPEQDKPESSVPTITTPKKSTFKPIKSEQVEGMDPQWVEAFDLKVGSRGARSLLVDTLSPTPRLTSLDELEFMTLDKEEKIPVGKKYDHVKHHTEKHGKKHFHDSTKYETTSDKNNTENSSSESDHSSHRDTWINTAVGSGMVVWYFGEGLSKIWHFFSS